MMRFSIIFLSFLIVGNIISVKKMMAADQCDAPTAQETVRIYFANGMENTRPRAEKGRDKLKEILGMSHMDFGVSYNANKNWFKQFLQVHKQRNNSSEDFWHWSRNLHKAPQWFRNEYAERIEKFRKKFFFNDVDLRMHMDQYLADLNSGKKVVIVAHSQGNFYANNAYRYIREDYNKFVDSIGIVSVATPATWVEGAPKNKINDYYTNNPNDLIINLVDSFYPSTLDPNVPPYPADTSLLQSDHGFVNTYLAGYKDRIRKQVFERIMELETPEKAYKCKKPSEVPVKVTTTSAGNISRTSAHLYGYVQSGKQIAGYCSWKPADSGNPQTCSSLRNKIKTSGNFDTGDSFYCTAKKLSENTTYNYRVCGREGNRISEGRVKSFKTKGPVVPCGTPLTANGGTEGLTTDFGMGTTAGYATVEFNAHTIKDALEIWHGRKQIYTTGGLVSGMHSNSVYHDPSRGQDWSIEVSGNADTGTVWELTISCPAN